MATTTIPLADDTLARLRAEAERAGVTPEELLARQVDAVLRPPEEAFRHAADRVLNNNAELYRRLA